MKAEDKVTNVHFYSNGDPATPVPNVYKLSAGVMECDTSSAWNSVGYRSQNLSQNVRMPTQGEGADHEPEPSSPAPISAATSRSSSLTSISGIDEEFDNIFDKMMRQFSRSSSTQLIAIIQDQTSEAAIWQTSTSWRQINQGAECLQKEAVVEWQERTACHLKAQIRFRAQRELDRRADNTRWAGAKQGG